ncbi:hypothetical protein B0H14DRAFT_3522255 [Mycena olivaceomarginata]|nr:hypothetical protein B0H14DRAFT_3522255 [Mycena olivaceomarginata]
MAFIRRYGYDLPFSENVDGDPEENPPVIPGNPDAEEKKRRDAIRKQLRTSRGNPVCMKKLANYFRNRWKGKKVHEGTIKSILGTMQTMSGPGSRPRRKPAIQVYSKLHYATRIKPGFDAIWEKAKETLPPGARVAMSQDYVRTCWEKEDDDFREDIENQSKELHQAALQEWKASRKIPEGSAEEYHEAMESLNDVGIPLADALAERLGCHVVILAVGPVGSEKGEVCLRTVFSDTSCQETSRTWAQFDNKGFTAMENSITRYGRAAFSRALCRERAWPPLETVPPPSLDGLLPMDPNTVAPVSVVPAPGAPAPDAPLTVAPAPVAPLTAAPPTATPSAIPASRLPSTVPLTATPLTVTPRAIPAPRLPSTAPLTATPSAIPTPLTVPDDGIDCTAWAPSLIAAHAYLSEKKWGPRWRALLETLVKHEWSFYHQEDDGNLPKM